MIALRSRLSSPAPPDPRARRDGSDIGAGNADRHTDAQVWDRFVAQARDGSILQSWAWGELKSRYGWEPTRYFWVRAGKVRGAVSVLRKPLPGGFAALLRAARACPRQPVQRVALPVGRAPARAGRAGWYRPEAGPGMAAGGRRRSSRRAAPRRASRSSTRRPRSSTWAAARQYLSG